MQANLKERFKQLVPGIFLLGYCIGTGSVTSMAKAGAEYGMALVWAVAVSCIITFFLIHLYGKFTIVTGEVAVHAIKKHIHPGLAIFIIVALGINISGSIMGVMGIVANVCHEWSKTLFEGGIKPLYFAIFFITLVYGLFWHGGMKFFEAVLVCLVGIMALAFLLNFFLLMPPWQELASGMIPSLPETEGEKNAILVIASMVGTTVFSGLFLMRGTLVKDAQWTLRDLPRQKTDALLSAVGMFVVSTAVMGAAAGTLHKNGLPLNNVSEMITLLAPLAGMFAVYIFTLGLVAAGVSSQFPNVILVPWLSNDYNNSPQNMQKWQHRTFVLVISLLGLVVPLTDARPVFVMIASQAFGATILPLTVGCIFYLGNKKALMGEHAFNTLTNIFLGAVLLFAVIMSYFAASALVSTLG